MTERDKYKHAIITGHSGVGKSTLIPFLSKGLVHTDILDFDSPDFSSELYPNGKVPDGADRAWRRKATAAWCCRLANAKRSILLIGHVLPNEFYADTDQEAFERWGMLIARPEIIVRRLALRAASPTGCQSVNVETWQEIIRRQVERQKSFRIFETVDKTPPEIAAALLGWLRGPDERSQEMAEARPAFREP